jgi:3-hydroxyacyl-CoA dehydrogenase/enoyl-CoA hydratase/3-hydroxybutyryl-CoA epimerase
VEVPERLQKMVEAGQLGRKSGRGFYTYQEKEMKPGGARSIAPEVGERLVLRLLNEAVACKREAVVENADLLDAGIVYGTGFAPFRGGPMQHIRNVGTESLQAKLKALSKQQGDRFTPDAGWPSLSEEENNPG